MKYPKSFKSNHVDTYFGTKVKDPYNWLEDGNSKKTKDWIKAQVKLTNNYFKKIPNKGLKKRITEVFNYPRMSAPSKHKGKYFFFTNTGLQNQDVLLMKRSLIANEEVLLDPNKFSKDGTTALSNLGFSKDGKYLSYGIQSKGSDWDEFFVMDIEKKKKLKDHIKWSKFSGTTWFKKGFFYGKDKIPKKEEIFTMSNPANSIYYHKLDTSQKEDQFVYKSKGEFIRSAAQVTEDEQFLIIYEAHGTSGMALLVKDLTKNKGFTRIVDDFNNDYGVVDSYKGKLIVATNYKAPMWKVVLIDPKKPAKKYWKTIIPEKKYALSSIKLVNDKLITLYLKDVCSRLKVYNIKGKFENNIVLPALGTVHSISAQKKDKEVFLTFGSYVLPTSIYRYDIAKKILS